ncbi:DUF2493 domain-containing protein [Phenylobacterium sp.]|uniref:DUF2493 domain-containing protein n=1 Tax=Phenylobacterium sp. TaxID=1871053 RepID=UPI0035B0E23D
MAIRRHPVLDTADLGAFDARTCALEDPRPHPTQDALVQLGTALMTELLDTLLGTALEDQAEVIAETFIGGLHAGAQRLERAADRQRDTMARRLREFDGSEVADHDLQDAKRAADAGDVAVLAVELVRDAAAAAYGAATGAVWSPWRGGVAANGVTAAQVDAEAALRAAEQRRLRVAGPEGPVVVFRASPQADSPTDASRIYDALNWARAQWPDLALGITGAPGGERIAKRWAQQKQVTLVLARPDFARHGRAAPFRANDQLLALDPVCVLTLARSLERPDAAGSGFGPALSLAQAAQSRGLRCVRIAARQAPPPPLPG